MYSEKVHVYIMRVYVCACRVPGTYIYTRARWMLSAAGVVLSLTLSLNISVRLSVSLRKVVYPGNSVGGCGVGEKRAPAAAGLRAPGSHGNALRAIYIRE